MVKLTEEMVAARTRMSDCTAVKKLNCWGTELTDVSILRKMRNVEILSLSVNNISTLIDFQNCVDLMDLFVRKNNIKDLNEICYLQGLTKLRNLWLGENPCAEIEGYRLSVIKTLPHLEKLDDKIITPEETQIAMVRGKSLIRPSNKIQAESSLPSSSCSTPEVTLAKCLVDQDIDYKQNYSSSDEQRNCDRSPALNDYRETDKKNANYDKSPVGQYPFNIRYSYEQNGRNKNIDNNSHNNSYSAYSSVSKIETQQDTNDRSHVRHNEDYDNSNQRVCPPISPRIQNSPIEYIDERRIEYDEPQKMLLDHSKQEAMNQNVEREDVNQIPSWTRCSSEKQKRRSQFQFQKRPVTRNSNILSAVLCLVNELDYPSLEVVEMAVKSRIDELEE